MRSDERLAQRIAQEVLPAYGAKSILDIGCGDGVVSQYLRSGCKYQGLDITSACIYEQHHENENIQYIPPDKIPGLMKRQGPWDMILLLDVIEHTRDFTGLFKLAMETSDNFVVISLPNELFIYDRIRMLAGKELNAHSLDLIKQPEGFKHQYIINIRKALSILDRSASDHNYKRIDTRHRPLIARNMFIRPILWMTKTLASAQVWSMGCVCVYQKYTTA